MLFRSKRMIDGEMVEVWPSRFLREVPSEFTQHPSIELNEPVVAEKEEMMVVREVEETIAVQEVEIPEPEVAEQSEEVEIAENNRVKYLKKINQMHLLHQWVHHHMLVHR